VLVDDISGYSIYNMKGGLISTYGITDQGAFKVTNGNRICFFKRFNYPIVIGYNGITAFEESTSTLIHCGGSQVFSSCS
jgi:hypothetical protein